MSNLFVSKEQKAIKRQLAVSQANYNILQVDKRIAVDKSKKLLGTPSGALGCFAAGFLAERIFLENSDNAKEAGKRIAMTTLFSAIKGLL